MMKRAMGLSICVLAGCSSGVDAPPVRDLSGVHINAGAIADGTFITVRARLNATTEVMRLRDGELLTVRDGDNVVPMKREGAGESLTSFDHTYVAQLPDSPERRDLVVELVSNTQGLIGRASGTIAPRFEASLIGGFVEVEGKKVVRSGEPLQIEVPIEVAKSSPLSCGAWDPGCELIEVQVAGDCVAADILYYDGGASAKPTSVQVPVKMNANATAASCPSTVMVSRFTAAPGDGPHTLSGRRSVRFDLVAVR